ncbi:hypothetical protein MLD38_013061 [Melastoma candidum]|uniref:Uncharacterized protein n=1 Tax=Melastoma candidum TaxID=119954 RepID=A0ACB9RGT3_9MYRT|nr:hypothetical protein MLD38_013061 [Melastoma candidum]
MSVLVQVLLQFPHMCLAESIGFCNPLAKSIVRAEVKEAMGFAMGPYSWITAEDSERNEFGRWGWGFQDHRGSESEACTDIITTMAARDAISLVVTFVAIPHRASQRERIEFTGSTRWLFGKRLRRERERERSPLSDGIEVPGHGNGKAGFGLTTAVVSWNTLRA